jgi:hypothetical protein
MGRIAVHPVSLGPNQLGSSDIFSAFHSLGCLVSLPPQPPRAGYAHADIGLTSGTLELASSLRV